MRLLLALIVAATFIARGAVFADQLPRPHAANKIDGFFAVAFITPDADWKEKWDTLPREVAPKFDAVETLSVGETATLLIGFSGAELSDGRALIACDLIIRRPSAEPQVVPAAPCYDKKLRGPVTDIYLAGMRVKIIAEATDAPGLWAFDIGVTDLVRRVRVPVSVSFVMKSGEETE